jgi:hypothetical protein
MVPQETTVSAKRPGQVGRVGLIPIVIRKVSWNPHGPGRRIGLSDRGYRRFSSVPGLSGRLL